MPTWWKQLWCPHHSIESKVEYDENDRCVVRTCRCLDCGKSVHVPMSVVEHDYVRRILAERHSDGEAVLFIGPM